LQTHVISDIHLGSTEAQHERFMDFVRGLPAGACLVLNGDVVNHATKLQPGQAESTAALRLLAEESHRRPVIWIRGNNDATFHPDDPGAIRFVDHYAIEHRLYICHGHRFLAPPPPVQWLLQRIGRACERLCARRMHTFHTSAYLRRVAPLYRLVCSRQAHAATAYARHHGYSAVACGHTHNAETRPMRGVTFFNTGSWTDSAPHQLIVGDQTMALHPIGNPPAPLPL